MARADGKDRGLFERPKASGVWWIRYHDTQGIERREKVGTKASARALYSLRKAAVIERRKLPTLGKRELTVRDLCERYLPEFATNKKRSDDDERIAKLWLAEIGDLPIDFVKPGDIERVKTKWQGKFAPATINRRLAFLKTVFNKAIRDELTEKNPIGFKRVKMMRDNPPDKPIITPEQEQKILDALDPVDRRAALFALHTGLRISEQVEAKRSQLNLKKSLLMLPNTKAGTRQEVHLNGVALSVLQEILAGPKSDWIFSQRNGTEPMTRDALSRRFTAVCHKLGFEGVVYHCLRHTFISRLVMLGIPIVTVQKLARHKDIKMTLRYAHLYPEHKAEALADLAKAYPI